MPLISCAVADIKLASWKNPSNHPHKLCKRLVGCHPLTENHTEENLWETKWQKVLGSKRRGITPFVIDILDGRPHEQPNPKCSAYFNKINLFIPHREIKNMVLRTVKYD